MWLTQSDAFFDVVRKEEAMDRIQFSKCVDPMAGLCGMDRWSRMLDLET